MPLINSSVDSSIWNASTLIMKLSSRDVVKAIQMNVAYLNIHCHLSIKWLCREFQIASEITIKFFKGLIMFMWLELSSRQNTAILVEKKIKLCCLWIHQFVCNCHILLFWTCFIALYAHRVKCEYAFEHGLNTWLAPPLLYPFCLFQLAKSGTGTCFWLQSSVYTDSAI